MNLCNSLAAPEKTLDFRRRLIRGKKTPRTSNGPELIQIKKNTISQFTSFVRTFGKGLGP